jgi:hypothetical protein
MAGPYSQETSDGRRGELSEIERANAVDSGQRPEPGRRYTPSNGFVDDHTSVSLRLALGRPAG